MANNNVAQLASPPATSSGWGSPRRPRRADYRQNLHLPETSGIYVTAQIMRRFRHTPTVEQLVDAYGMSRATAFRWRHLIKAAKGEF